MTYYNANVYVATPTLFAHDDCLPDDQFTTHTFGNGDTLRQQVSPWNWSPIYGAPKPCYVCGQPVS